jgi:NitT/TauT family transport system substrate-binding protein
MSYSYTMRDAGGWKALARPAVGLAILGSLAFGFGSLEGRELRRRGPEAGTQRAPSLRLAYFPNLTHAPALAGVARGEFQRELGGQASLDPKVFNAGPEEMEALLAGEVDLGYVGPSPAVNTYLRSNGRALRILAGACSGGAALVARPEARIASVADLDGKRVADPQLGGTQDISLRRFLAANGLRPRETGGTVQILPVKNPDILPLLKQGELDAAWVPEPWATRLVREAGARLVVDERDLWPNRRFTTTVLVARADFLRQRRAQVEAVLRAHLSAIDWLQRHPGEGQAAVNQELQRLTGKALPAEVLREAWGRVDFASDPDRSSIETFARAAAAAGYLKDRDIPRALAGLFDLRPLQNAGFPVASAGR